MRPTGKSPADESWRHINAIDDVTQTLIEATGQLIVAAMQGYAGAGGVLLALAADEVWARPGLVLNPHYKNMGKIYGSEYWTYLLPRRLDSAQDFISAVHERAQRLAASADLPMLLHTKQQRHDHDEAARPLADDRAQELQHMQRCFYGFDPSYHIASSNFVHRVAPSWTPRHLATHRRQATR